MVAITMREVTDDIAGLSTVVISPAVAPFANVVMLHGYAMTPRDLAPFAHSMTLPARFLVPAGPVAAIQGGSAWWEIDHDARAGALAAGPRDLHLEHPAGAAEARAHLLRFLHEVQARWSRCPVVLIGFSQGGMLACDVLLRDRPAIAAMALLSTSRIFADEWRPLLKGLRELPVFVSHGRTDADLAFSAGEALRDLLAHAGARVMWVPHAQGHEIPLVVWRQLRKFLSVLA